MSSSRNDDSSVRPFASDGSRTGCGDPGPRPATGRNAPRLFQWLNHGVFGTLRFRLAAWNAAAVVLIAAGTLLAVRWGFRRALLADMDAILREDRVEVELALSQAYPNYASAYEELDRKAIGHVQHGWFVQVFDPSGKALFSSKNTPTADWASEVPSPNALIEDAGHRRLEARLDRGGLPPLGVRLGCTTRMIDDGVAAVTRTTLLAGIALLAVAPLCGYWLAGRATRPLADIIAATSAMHPSNLNERLPLRGTEDELDRLSRTINGLLDRLADFVVQKRTFIANAAHELRSPLAAVQATAEVALAGVRTSSEFRDTLEEIHEECRELSLLVHQLLFLAESDAGTLELGDDVVGLDAIVGKSIDMFRGIAEAKRVELVAARLSPIAVRGSKTHLRQVVNNLLDNAVKFAPEGGRVSVELVEEAGAAMLRIADDGPGVPVLDLPYIFDRFYQADKARDREPTRRGSGLGLSICKSIVTAYGGTISVHSAQGKGSVFTVSLPVAKTEAKLRGEEIGAGAAR